MIRSGDPAIGHSGIMRAPTAVLLVLALLTAGGCALIDGKDRVGSLVASWSQGDHREIQQWAPDQTVVLADAAARDRFLDGLPSEVDTSAVEDIDLAGSFLVLSSYGKCMEESRVWMDRRRTAVWFEVYVPREHRNTACSWSPITVDIWQVPASELDQTPAERLRTEEPE